MENADIKIGDRVRSFDFAVGDYGRDLRGWSAAYVEGEVIGFVEVEGCQRYQIRVDRSVFRGYADSKRVGRVVTPPVNGTPTYTGVTDFVEKV